MLRNSYLDRYGSVGSLCKPCTSRRAKKTYRSKKYGLDDEAFAEILDRQLGGCAICSEPHRPDVARGSLCVDHDHKTGAVRGLLCGRCNVAIGMLAEDEKRLYSAIRYLRENCGLLG